MKLTILLCGIHSLFLAIFHIFFWKIFNWKKDLKNTSVANRAIIQIMNLRLIFLFFGMAFLCFYYPQELTTSSLGKAILIGMSLFWLGRLIEQFIFLPYNKLFIHTLSAVFFLGFVLFLAAALSPDAHAQTSELQKSLNNLVLKSKGRIGICALDTAEKDPICVNGEDRFPLQSVMKVVVAGVVLDAIDKEQMQLEDTILVKPEDASPGPQDFANLIKSKGGLKVKVEELIERSVIESDSTAVDLLLKRLGGVTSVQKFLKRHAIRGISIDRNEKDLQAESVGLKWKVEYSDPKKLEAAQNALSTEQREKAWNSYLKDPRDTSTPKGMVDFLKKLATGKLLSKNSTQKLLSIMSRTTTGPDRLRAGTPKDWSLGHKTGTGISWKNIHSATNDVGILTSPKNKKIAIAVFVAESSATTKEREAVIANAAKLVTTGSSYE